MLIALAQIKEARKQISILEKKIEDCTVDLQSIFRNGNMITLETINSLIELNGVAEIAPGVLSHKVKDTKFETIHVVKFAPYAILGAHKHDVDEYIYIRSGNWHDGADKIEDGYLIPKFTLHTISAGQEGGIIEVVFKKNIPSQ